MQAGTFYGRGNEWSTGLDTLGGEFGLCWNDTIPLTTVAHNAFLSAFIEACWVFDHLVETYPPRLTSNSVNHAGAERSCSGLGGRQIIRQLKLTGGEGA